MRIRAHLVIVASVLIIGAALDGHGQGAPPDRTSTLIGRPSDDDNERPRSIRESLERMRIERDKKEYNQMIARGEEVLKLSEQVEKAFQQAGQLSPMDYARIANIEKLAKRIREDLGGDDDGEDEDQRKGLSPADAVKSLRAMTVSLFEQLKRTSRFSISATAIESTNALLKITRFLRITR
jgi:hypothetical protein